MLAPAFPTRPRGLALALGWRRLACTLALSLAVGGLLGIGWTSGPASVIGRTLVIGLVAMLAFGVFEQWPSRLPRWLPRWVLQVASVAVAMPPTVLAIYVWSTPPGAPPFWQDQERLGGFGMLMALSLLLAPWTALGALVRQKEAFAQHQALAFDLERSELARQALDARMRLLQAQVAPHFLFNTLANVQALVDTGSPQAPAVLRSLIAYLRAAVPRLDAPATTLAQEVELVRAYLELMHMRMPDRLQFDLHVDAPALAVRCPPLTLLTLVENAVRHGIDPSEEGGRIDVDVQWRDGRCVVRVCDTGVGLRAGGGGLGTGLSTLRERLALAFGSDARLQLTAAQPRGVCAEVDFPAQETRT
jgi:signal transduction histidine kinase